MFLGSKTSSGTPTNMGRMVYYMPEMTHASLRFIFSGN